MERHGVLSLPQAGAPSTVSKPGDLVGAVGVGNALCLGYGSDDSPGDTLGAPLPKAGMVWFA